MSLSSLINRSEDVEIHSLKVGEVAALATPVITDLTHKLLEEDEIDEEDLFASVDKEDEGELEQVTSDLHLQQLKGHILHNSYAMLHLFNVIRLLKF